MCKTGMLLFLIAFMFACLSCLNPIFWSLFIFTLIDWIVTIIPAFYIEVVNMNHERNKEKDMGKR
jgi:hypothetical protein